ncbi:MAG TPA: hypothetical protein VIJ92_08070 [Ginsengibacter sp.]
MSIPDSWVTTILIFFILLHTVVLIGGLITHKLLIYVSFLNVVTALIVIIYWIQQQLRITQHIYEAREMIFLGLQTVILAVSIYSIVSHFYINHWVRIIQYLLFSIQFISLLLLLLVMLFFKMDRLM